MNCSEGKAALHQKVMLLINQDNFWLKLQVYVGLVPPHGFALRNDQYNCSRRSEETK